MAMVSLAVKCANGIFLAIECAKLSDKAHRVFSDPLFNICPCMGTKFGSLYWYSVISLNTLFRVEGWHFWVHRPTPMFPSPFDSSRIALFRSDPDFASTRLLASVRLISTAIAYSSQSVAFSPSTLAYRWVHLGNLCIVWAARRCSMTSEYVLYVSQGFFVCWTKIPSVISLSST